MGCGDSGEDGTGVSKELREEDKELCAYNIIDVLFLTNVKKNLAHTAISMVNFIEIC